MTIKVSSLHTYPLKSAHVINLAECEITPKGPKFDRQFMLVHDSENRLGQFISQRDRGFEKLALVKTEIIDPDNEIFSFSVRDRLKYIEISKRSLSETVGRSQVWKSQCETVDAGDEAASFFSDYFNAPVRLVAMAPEFKRQVDLDFSHDGDSVNFADGFPILFANQKSLESLSPLFNAGARIDMGQFRPNIVLDGLAPFAEDHIAKLQIGSLVFEFLKPCSRCVMTTIDQTSGGKPFGNEPISTLSKFRKGNGDGLQGVFFGQNAILRNETGIIRVGDEVKILELKEPHPAVANTGLRFNGSALEI